MYSTPKLSRFIIWHIIFCLSLNLGIAQSSKFNKPTHPSGFLSNTTTCLAQDHQGFIWLGTTDGLARYDGKEIIEYRNIPGDTTSISNNYIQYLYVDPSGKIWIGTKRGLNCFDPEQESFARYFYTQGQKFESENYIISILQDHKGYIWYGTYHGLFRLDPNLGEHLQLLPDPENPNAILDQAIFTVFEDQKKRLWIGGSNGISLYDNDDKFTFKNFKTKTVDAPGLKTYTICSFVQQKNGTIWFSSYDGFYQIQENSNGISFREFLVDPKYNNGRASNYIQHITAEGNHKFWLSSYNQGLIEVELPMDNIEEINYIFHAPQTGHTTNGINAKNVRQTINDRSGDLWVATTRGLNQLKLNANPFHTILPKSDKTNSLNNAVVTTIFKDSKANLWVGTIEGLNFLNAKNLKEQNYQFQNFLHQNTPKINPFKAKVYNIMEDSQGFLWLTAFNGLYYLKLDEFDGQNANFKRFGVKDGLPNNFIYSILEIKSNEYWIATYGELSRMNFDPTQGLVPQFQNFNMDDKRDDALINSMTFQACPDRFGNIWIATFSGLSKCLDHREEGVFENHILVDGSKNSISDNSIICFLKDRQDRLWIGTRNGLNLVKQNKIDQRASFQNFGIKHGLTNTVIQSIQEDEKGFLWLGTNNGLFQFDPEKALLEEKAVLNVFKKEDGLSGGGFIFRSSFKDEYQNLFFGTANGITYFDPADLKTNTNAPNVIFTKLKVLNQEVIPSKDKDAILKKSISHTDSLCFTYQQNIFSLEFAALEFTNPAKNQFAYQLEGFNEDWVYNQTQNKVNYTNLPPGAYVLKVKASNNNGVWSQSPKQLFIRVLPPPWKTWWAYLLYLISFIGILSIYIRLLTQKRLQKMKEQILINAAREEERELLRKKNAADYHDELGHRITKISLFVELAERQLSKNKELTTFLGKIKKNTRELSEGIKDLIWSLDPSQDTLFQTLSRLQEFGDRLFDFTSIKFKTEGISPILKEHVIEADKRKQILLIFKEAMNNCLKYSAAENAILSSQFDGTSLKISFVDDGIGLSTLDYNKGYGIKNMQERAQKINAILDIASELNAGTSIQLDLKIPHMG